MTNFNKQRRDMLKKDLDAFNSGRSGLTNLEQGDAVAAADAQNQSAASALMMQAGQQGMAGGTGASKAMNAEAIKASQDSIRGARADVMDMNQRIIAQRRAEIKDALAREEAIRQQRLNRIAGVATALAPSGARLAEKAIPVVGKLLRP